MAKDWKHARFCSVRAFLIKQVLKLNKRFWENREDIPVTAVRARILKVSALVPRIPDTIQLSVSIVDSVPLHCFAPREADQSKVILYLHGGGYVAGSPLTTHRELISRIASQAGTNVVAVNYRKAPEHPFPAALNDANKAYQWLLERYAPGDIVVMGDSAGGGLSLALTLQLRDSGLPMPGKVVALSPWTDLAGSGPSVKNNMHTDVMVPGHLITQLGALYCDPKQLTDPYVSPLYAEFTGFPEILIQVSDSEVLLDDACLVADKMRASGVSVKLDIWHNLPHVWPIFARVMPEGRAAILDIVRFIAAP